MPPKKKKKKLMMGDSTEISVKPERNLKFGVKNYP